MFAAIAGVKISCSFLITSAMVFLMTVLFITTGAAHVDLIYQRDAFFAGEIWRGVSAHFIHCDL